MNDQFRPSRRGTFALAAGAAALPLLAAKAAPILPPPHDAAPTASHAARARLGRRLQAILGADQSNALVATHLAAARKTGAAADGPALAARIADDFRSGQVHSLDGFVIARTEAALWLIAAGVSGA